MKEKAEKLAREMASMETVKAPGELRAQVSLSLFTMPIGVDEEAFFKYTGWDTSGNLLEFRCSL